MPAEVDEVQDILFEAGTAEADAGIQKLWADAAVHADGPGDLGDIGLRLFAEGGDGVDRGDPLGKEGIGDELGELAAPDVGGDDLFLRNPVCVDVHEDLPAPPVRAPFPGSR